MRKYFFVLLFSSLTACSWSDKNYAPVTLANTIEPLPHSGTYRVKHHETLYSIAWRYGLDYRYLAQRNHIKPPYHIEPSQLIYLRGKPALTPHIASSHPLLSPPKIHKQPLPMMPLHTMVSPPEKEPTAVVKGWRWPARGPVIGTYSSMNKGINISGHLNDPIFATAAGKVVYSGSGLRGYGNLIIIKHNSSYLTAYAHNKQVFVSTGEWVKAGQKIAQMGNSGAERVMLHFEIRYNGRPVNPLNFLRKNI